MGVERVIITNGGFHGLSLAVLSLVERGGLVAVDNPIFPLFLRALELADGRTLPVRVGPAGLDVDELEEKLRAGARPTALYTVPDFHNPSQGTLSSADRVRLVELAERYGFVVLADNPYRELRFRGEAADAGVFNTSDHVVHVNTFSKTLGPGLRLGWVVASERIAKQLTTLRNRQDSHTSTLEQRIVVDLLTHDPQWFDRTLDRARDLYRERADAVVDALDERFGGPHRVGAPRRRVLPAGHGWSTRRSTRSPCTRPSAERGATYQQGEFFASSGRREFVDHLRLAYGNHTPETLREFVDRLRLRRGLDPLMGAVLHVALEVDGAGAHPAAAARHLPVRPTACSSAAHLRRTVAVAENAGVSFVTFDDSLTHPSRDRRRHARRVRRAPHVAHRAGAARPPRRHRAVPPRQPGRRPRPRVDRPLRLARRAPGPSPAPAPPSTARSPQGQDLLDETRDVVRVVRDLWDSWEDDAVIRDTATGRYIDRDRVHYVDFTSGGSGPFAGPDLRDAPDGCARPVHGQGAADRAARPAGAAGRGRARRAPCPTTLVDVALVDDAPRRPAPR